MSTDLLSAIGTAGLAVFIYMSIWYLIALLAKRNDIADIAWGLGFILVTLVTISREAILTDRDVLITALVILWGIRLALHIHARNRGKKEDFRYKQWREEWGKSFYIRTYLQVFLLQGFFLLLISLPIIIGISQTGNDSWQLTDFLGLAVWSFGFIFETVGDWQLTRFMADPANKGKLLQSGTWRYTRHPNYFGEVTLWWGLWFISLATANSMLGIIGPLTISFLIIKVSGIPLLEKAMKKHPDWPEYAKKTSVFFPLPPKKPR